MNLYPILLLATLLFSINAKGQGLPTTNITLLDFNIANEQVFENPQFLTGFNKSGYNNQPSFFDVNTLYITSDWNASGPTDIVKLNLLREALIKVTDVSGGVYSPTLTPTKRSFSSIMAPKSNNGDNPQFLWEYPLDRSNSGRPITQSYSNVGYHLWLNNENVALFLVGEPHQLVIYNVKTNASKEVSTNIGRCLKLNKNNELIYVHKSAGNIWYLKSYNITTGKQNIIGETKSGSEDFDVLPDNSIIMGQGSKMYLLSELGGWKEIGDLGDYNINKVTRITTHGNKIAIVHAS